ncbi:MAG: WGR domain-containing protein [Candidatus Tectomicrobia bacterium]|nr:WGR domain-containing protein [Candidatus Tectomicrobia bacterium]
MLAFYTYLEKQDATMSPQWFYALSVQPTLFGDWSVVREWGRVGSPGRVKVKRYTSQAAAETAFDHLVQAKYQQGYR